MDNEQTTPVEEGVNASAETPHTAPEQDGKAQANEQQTKGNTPLTETDTKAIEYLEGWQRTRAEFANYKKRVEKELRESQQRGAYDAIVKILPIVDDFERALSSIPEELKENPWTNGVSLLLRKFEKLMQEYNVETVDPVGQPFDPNQHEAIGTEDSDEIASGHVVATLQKGYVAGERVLRPALVKVAN